LYNHGGWFGEPENQLAIIDYLKMPNIGMVYNFSHSEEQIHRFPEFYPKILPHLFAINLTGLQGGIPAKVVPIGEGNIEYKMMKIIEQSGYAGPIGIINEDFAPDAEDGLKMNMEGLKKYLMQENNKAALKTY
jgi:sugar phosphate isomerase/epimerase